MPKLLPVPCVILCVCFTYQWEIASVIKPVLAAVKKLQDFAVDSRVLVGSLILVFCGLAY